MSEETLERSHDVPLPSAANDNKLFRLEALDTGGEFQVNDLKLEPGDGSKDVVVLILRGADRSATVQGRVFRKMLNRVGTSRASKITKLAIPSDFLNEFIKQWHYVKFPLLRQLFLVERAAASLDRNTWSMSIISPEPRYYLELTGAGASFIPSRIPAAPGDLEDAFIVLKDKSENPVPVECFYVSLD